MADDKFKSQPLDAVSLLQQLHDEDRRVQAAAVYKLRQFPQLLLPEIARIFQLAVNGDAAISAYSRVAIENMGAAAIPFLLNQCRGNCAAEREQAIQLLAQIGHCGGEPHKFATQFLGERNDRPPNWSNYVETVLETVANALTDADCDVRFAAASVLEDCNHLIERTVPIFIEVLAKGTSFQKNWAALRLGRIGPSARSAYKSLADLAAGPADIQDMWDKYSRQAAKVAIERIGSGI
jgi:HEAT repeat protein